MRIHELAVITDDPVIRQWIDYMEGETDDMPQEDASYGRPS